MAVNLMAAPTAINNPWNRSSYHQDFRSQTPSASSSNSTISPPSPRNGSTSTSPGSRYAMNSRQLRAPKTPLYVPAVLRPTENPARHRPSKSSSSNSVSRVLASSCASPLTPPSSAESSFDSKSGQTKMEASIQQRLLANEGITRIVTDEWSSDMLEEVTGAPTRDHWKPDSSSPKCDSPICAIPFTILRRRHHCRRCGNIYCSPHSRYEVPLDQHARFHPSGNMARACDNCWNDYTAWKRRRSQQSSTSGSEGSGTSTPTPLAAGSGGAKAVHTSGLSSSLSKNKDIAGSMSRDWNWSTF